MRHTKCPCCHGDRLAHGRILAGVEFRPSFLHANAVALHGAACLACGAVIPYLDDAALGDLRAANAKEASAKEFGDDF